MAYKRIDLRDAKPPAGTGLRPKSFVRSGTGVRYGIRRPGALRPRMPGLDAAAVCFGVQEFLSGESFFRESWRRTADPVKFAQISRRSSDCCSAFAFVAPEPSATEGFARVVLKLGCIPRRELGLSPRWHLPALVGVFTPKLT